MRSPSRWKKVLTLVAAAAVLAALPAAARADRVWTRANPQAKPFERKDLKILRLENGNLVFNVIASGRQDARPLTEIFQIEATGETRLNAAEAAFAAGDFAKATAEYQAAIDTSKSAWVKLRSASRVVESAANSKNFPAAVKGYAELLKIDPAIAESFKPAIPAGAPGTLKGSVDEAIRVANSAGLSADQKGQILTLALELARADGDNKRASDIANMLSGVPATTGAGTPGAPATGGGSGDANRRIQLALVAIGNKQFDQALKQINDAPDSFIEPADQVEALYCLAEAKYGLAKDTEAMKDAALDYMRAVARAKAANLNSPRVPDALYKTAVIHERIRAAEEAAILYQQVASEYAGTEFGTKAAAALARLEKKEQS